MGERNERNERLMAGAMHVLEQLQGGNHRLWAAQRELERLCFYVGGLEADGVVQGEHALALVRELAVTQQRLRSLTVAIVSVMDDIERYVEQEGGEEDA